jgi:NAD(P)-dependent dehydrogenase (short-subunit alcohol dehydrogenase family)
MGSTKHHRARFVEKRPVKTGEVEMTLSVLPSDSVAVITGGAAGIGLAAAKRFALRGFRVCIADLGRDRIEQSVAEIAALAPAGREAVAGFEADVAEIDDLRRLDAGVRARFGGTDVLMNNAGVQPGSGMFGPQQNWRRVLDVNLWGVIHGTQVFVPGMIARGRPGLVINTGSKQGITTPPGDPAYNVAKAGVKAFTEALQHELRNTADCRISAHLLIPGFVYTELTARGRVHKPAGAWTTEQTIDFMLGRLEAGDFYILCPDNDVPRSLDERRILWAAGDIVENRPPLSRWHPDYADAFKVFSDTSRR